MDYSDLMLDINGASQCLIKLFPPKVELHCVGEQGRGREEKRFPTATPTTPRLEVPPANLGFSRTATPFPAFKPRSCTPGPLPPGIPYRFGLNALDYLLFPRHCGVYSCLEGFGNSRGPLHVPGIQLCAWHRAQDFSSHIP